MGRPPCCDKVGIKKGPWTPEEDIILVSYIQEHGPGNWRSVPTNTGLLRCSKSCRLRWTNYLRPGIKRGNFTPHEEGMIIHLQALLGNKWAAIASYLPQRTDNDIKNYWNTHLKKKLKKFQSALDPAAQDSPPSFVSKSFSERSRNILDMTPNSSSTLRPGNHHTSSTSTSVTTSANTAPYASSAENISRLLEGWMKSSPKPNSTHSNSTNDHRTNKEKWNLENNDDGTNNVGNNSISSATSLQCYRPKGVQEKDGNGGINGGDIISHEEFESILSFENLSNVVTWDHKSTCDSTIIKDRHQDSSSANDGQDKDTNNNIIALLSENKKQKGDQNNNNAPLSFLEKWLFDETGGGQVEEESMQLSPIF